MRLLIAEKAGGLLDKPKASRLSCPPPQRPYMGGISLSQPSQINFMFAHTPKENLSTRCQIPKAPSKKQTFLLKHPETRKTKLRFEQLITEQLILPRTLRIQTLDKFLNGSRLNPLNIQGSVKTGDARNEIPHIFCCSRAFF